MCFEGMYYSRERQKILLKERKKALKERLDKIDEMIEALEKEQEQERIASEAVV